MASLREYRSKRDPTRTGRADADRRRRRRGPPGATPSSSRNITPRALHWDFRLERDGVLVSWAVPKGIPPDPKANHLAVHTEDHPLEYASFEGTIARVSTAAGR